jgi:prolyl oligopeptidase PreP (S9A serine peptidase family)
MTKAVLSILRQAAEPLTSRDIALELLVTRALDKDDQKLLAEPAAGGHGYGKDNRERASFTALGYNFLRPAIGWESDLGRRG